MNLKIVADSSANIFTYEGLDYTTVPLKIITGEKEYVDTPELDLQGMVSDLKKYKGKSGSSCPNTQEWLEAFGDAEYVFGLTITKHLSGSYNAAQQAAQIYMQEHPERTVFIIDSLSTGPEMMMIVDKIHVLSESGADFDTIRTQVLDYANRNHTLFCLQSLNNLARNGRVSPAVAKIAGVLNIRVAGDVQGGEITPQHKPRGDRKAIQTLVSMMAERGIYDGALVRIAHCYGEHNALALKAAIQEQYPNCRFIIEPTAALCSFYAEEGGLIIGFEGSFNEKNDNRKF